MTLSHQAVLMIAFGGPDSPAEIRPFLDRVLRGVAVPPERIEEVVRHYEAVGGRSPINEITSRQAEALRRLLAERSLPMPVYVGTRNAGPFFVDALKRMAQDGVRRALGFILSPHRSEASWERYRKNIAVAQAELGGEAPEIDYCPGWHDHPLFVETLAQLIEASFDKLAVERRGATALVFTAHSLPVEMAAHSPYAAQVADTARLVAARLGHRRWSIAYQSRSGGPGEPWLEPDIGRAIRDLAAGGATAVVAAPIGFVCDHVEVLYDLDIEARKIAEGLGLRFIRSGCPNDHPTFIRMIADIVEAGWNAEAAGDR